MIIYIYNDNNNNTAAPTGPPLPLANPMRTIEKLPLARINRSRTAENYNPKL